MFFGSDYGSERTCCLNGIDPQAYRRHILSVLLKWLMAVKRDFTLRDPLIISPKRNHV
ncbi:transposase domain-containing protein [Escherichia coli]|nr:transposase domain-containing protein [Escherichia coli]ELK1152989.1 transposase domain-containing protein [Escherichia coli]